MKIILFAFLFAMLYLNLYAEKPVKENFPENLISNGNFKDGMKDWNAPSWHKHAIKPEIDKSIFHGVSAASLKIKGEKDKNGFVIQRVKLPPGKNREFTLTGWIKTQNFQNNWTARIGVAFNQIRGEIKVYKSPSTGTSWQLKDSDWKQYKVAFKVPDNLQYINAVLETKYPKKGSGPNLGIAWFDSIELCPLDKSESRKKIPVKNKIVEFYPGFNKGIFYPKQSPEFKIEFSNPSGKDLECGLNYAIKDFDGKKLYSNKFNLTVKPGSCAHTLNLPGQSQTGFYSVELNCSFPDKTEEKKISSFVVARPQKKNDEFFGLNGIIMNKDFAKPAADAGVGSVGFTANWYDASKKNYNFAKLDEKYKAYVDAGMKPIGQVSVSSRRWRIPEKYFKDIRKRKKENLYPYPEEYYEDFGKYIKNLFSHYSNIEEWVFTEEIDLSMEKDSETLERYVKKIKTGYKEGKKANPQCVIYGLGVSGCDSRCIPRFPKARKIWPMIKDSLDGMALDCYINPKTFGPGRRPSGPERGQLTEILEEAKKLSKQNGKEKVFISEKGVNIITALPVDSKYAKDMAKIISRHLIVAKSVAGISHYLYFTCYSYNHGDHDYGLWKGYSKQKHHPRPALAAYATTARLLAHTGKAHPVKLHDDIIIYVFEKGKGSVLTLWTLNKEPVALKFEFKEDVPVFDLMGREISHLNKGQNSLSLSDAPLFIPSNIPASKLAEALKKASYSLPELKAELAIQSSESLRVYLKNLTSQKLKASARIESGPGTEKQMEIPPLNCGFLDFKISGGLKKIKNKDVAVNVLSEKSNFKISKNIDPVFIPYAKEGINTGRSPLLIDKLDQLFPVDAFPNGLWTGKNDLSSKLWLSWDEDNFYINVEVTDDIFIQKNLGMNIWANDSIQFAFDTGNNALNPEFSSKQGYDVDDYEFIAALTEKGPQLYCSASAVNNPEMKSSLLELPGNAIKVKDNKIFYNIAIPWKKLAPLKGRAGEAFKFNLNILDSDEGKTANYWMGITEGICGGKDPSKFKTFILDK